MVLRGVQRSEIIVIGLDLGTLIHLKAHGCENVGQLVAHSGYRVKIAVTDLNRRHGNIDLLGFVTLLLLLLF